MAEDESQIMALLRGLTTKLEGMDKRLNAELEGMGSRLERIESHMRATPTAEPGISASPSTNSIPTRTLGRRVSLLDVQEESTHDARSKPQAELPPLSVGTSARRASGSTAGKVVPLPSNSSNDSGAESAGPTPLRKRGETRSRLSGSEVPGSEADKGDDETSMELTSLDRLIEQAEDEVLGAAFDSISAVGEIKLSLAFDIFCVLSGCGPCPQWWSARVHTATRVSAASALLMMGASFLTRAFLSPKATQWEVLKDRGLVIIAFEVWGFHDNSWSTAVWAASIVWMPVGLYAFFTPYSSGECVCYRCRLVCNACSTSPTYSPQRYRRSLSRPSPNGPQHEVEEVKAAARPGRPGAVGAALWRSAHCHCRGAVDGIARVRSFYDPGKPSAWTNLYIHCRELFGCLVDSVLPVMDCGESNTNNPVLSCLQPPDHAPDLHPTRP